MSITHREVFRAVRITLELVIIATALTYELLKEAKKVKEIFA